MSQVRRTAPPQEAGPGKALGIVAIVCGAVGLCVPGAALIGLVLGIVGLVLVPAGQKKLPKIGVGLSGAAVVLNVLLLVLILMPALTAARQAAAMSHEMSNLNQVGWAFHAFAADNKGRCPHHASDLSVYLTDEAAIFTAPRADPTQTVLPAAPADATQPYTYGCFTFAPLGGFSIGTFYSPSGMIVAYSDQPRGVDGKYRAVLFLDGHVQMMLEADFAGVLAENQQHMPTEDRRRLEPRGRTSP